MGSLSLVSTILLWEFGCIFFFFIGSVEDKKEVVRVLQDDLNILIEGNVKEFQVSKNFNSHLYFDLHKVSHHVIALLKLYGV